MEQKFYSNGKLLITGEYVVLDGARALALPTRYGQSLNVKPATGKLFKWTSKDADGTVWFEADIPFEAVINKNHKEDEPVYNTLVDILFEAYKANPRILSAADGFEVVTELSFPRNWGLGTSSTLINNIAQWFSIDAFRLLQNSFGGSGYDIACAQNDSPILYRLQNTIPIVEQIRFHPSFANNLYFVYLNKKQNSRTAIASYKKKTAAISPLNKSIDKLTHDILAAQTLPEFQYAVDKHESLLSAVLETATIKETLFDDFSGSIKSLGAWGGDFILAATEYNPTDYFSQKGYAVVIPYNSMILT